MMFGTNPHSGAVAERIPEDSVGIELGVWKGATAAKFLATGKVKHLHLVDAWSVEPYRESKEHAGGFEGYLERYSKFTGSATEEDFQESYDYVCGRVRHRFRHDPITIHRMTTDEFFMRLPGLVDWVYVDASHDEDAVFRDLSNSLDVVKPGGSIFGDDYGNASKPGVQKAVDRFVAEHGLTVDNFYEDQFQICMP